MREKFYHAKDFPGVKIPKNLDCNAIQKLPYQDRLEYLSDHNNLPEESVTELQVAVVNFLEDPNTVFVPGASLGKEKIEGIAYINPKTQIVAFVDSNQ